jgi:hypothetical protein
MAEKTGLLREGAPSPQTQNGSSPNSRAHDKLTWVVTIMCFIVLGKGPVLRRRHGALRSWIAEKALRKLDNWMLPGVDLADFSNELL